MNNILGKIVAALYSVRKWLLSQQWFTSKLLPALPRPIRWTMRKLYFLPSDLIERIMGRQEDMIPLKSQIFTGAVDNFKSSGQELVLRLKDYAGTTPESNILDIGSGMGRLGVALTSFLSSEGSYEGLDIVPSAIKWCNDNITAKYPNIRFVLADIYNKEYNPKGQIQASEYHFPFEDGTFDIVVLSSVFTHMLPPETEHYVAEISRMLKKGGRCYATFSLIDDETREAMEAGRSVLLFSHHEPPYWSVGTQVPELAVAYDEPYVHQLYERHGLCGQYTIHYGGWSGRASLMGKDVGFSQDIVVSTKE